MEIVAKKQNGSLIVTLVGEMDEHASSGARRIVDDLIDKNARCENAVFDLAGVSFMDSTGIGFLIGRYKKLRRLGIPLFIVNPNDTADKILSVSGVYSLIPKTTTR